ncbi:DinB family protein [Mucilaginibacter pallidiroseus]|uniref:DinB family protein n=1 Tax=Mucilaginibacter pallidiroseus TaxID=2599295 RepID=A0A563U0H9_9SPHI|nr:DinB family protein [Mucilaginibacter pallidiroseus]TWR25138.1 DinB family protein [Mucilaginibacter pallidiroseus]
MEKATLPEVWLRGPLDNVPPVIQPVAHALLQAREELNVLMQDFPDSLLWQQVAGMASPAFHLQHLTGVLNRLFTYARKEVLSTQQLAYLAEEGKPTTKIYSTAALVAAFNAEVDNALAQLAAEDESQITDYRAVGRGKLPSSALGLYVHSAEHTMRHLGQLLVTVKVLIQQLDEKRTN